MGEKRTDWLYVWQFAAPGAFVGGAAAYAAGRAWPSYWGHTPQQALEMVFALMILAGPLIGVIGASTLSAAWRAWSTSGMLAGAALGYVTYLAGLGVGTLVSGQRGGQGTVGWAFAAGALLTVLCPAVVIRMAGEPSKGRSRRSATPGSTGE
jgi:hypothetical protein